MEITASHVLKESMGGTAENPVLNIVSQAVKGVTEDMDGVPVKRGTDQIHVKMVSSQIKYLFVTPNIVIEI